jgi:FixJ family two-component response regulator
LPGCLILDVRLPGQNGLDFQEELAKAEISMPVIIMTGYADVPMTIRAMKAGAIEFLTKPVLPQRLLTAIQFAIEAGPSRPRAPRWFDSADTEIRQHRGGLAPWQERRAKEVVANGLSTELPISQVATECGMSRGHFARAFKQSTGATPHQWLTRQRIEKAKGLMLEGVSLAEVALLCGFADQSHFSRVFARSEGRPPGAWQRGERYWAMSTPK